MTKQLTAVASKLPSLEQLVIVPLLDTGKFSTTVPQCSWLELMATPSPRIDFEELPFDHPVYIMYSSGTTGVPKGIIHGAGGTLLQHYKEHVLHTNLKRDDLILYYTTCGWMMWNWLVSALAVGTTIFLYDGSPVWPDTGILWKAIEQEGIAVFGTSPKYLASCQQQGLVPSKQFDLSSLRTILSTGSPLTAENYSWVYADVKKDVQLASISGGTDIISCFLLGNPNLPVLSEEIQCRGLGMKVAAYDDQGKSVTDKVGELVCTAPFPSMPVAFWNDPGSKRYRQAYFEDFPGVWRHGDYIKITEHGGVIVYGRSDATLNPGGIRIGTAEIYGPVEGMPEVADSIVIGQQWLGDIRIVLFVMLTDGLSLTELLIAKIKKRIVSQTTPRHVPVIILQVDDIPHTMNGKKVEMAVRQVVEGQEVPNRSALANPEALDQFASFPQLKAV